MTRDAYQAQLDLAPQFAELYKTIGPQEAQTLQDIQKLIAPQMAQLQLDQQRQFAPQQIDLSIENLKRADPTGFQIRQDYGNQVLGDLKLGNQLSPEEIRQIEQETRAGQVQRGETYGGGLSGSLEESINKATARESRGAERQARAGAFLAGVPQPVNQANAIPQIGAPTQPTMPFSQLFPSTNQLISTERSRYGSPQLWQPQIQQGTNPFLQGLGMAGGMAANAATIFAAL